MSNFRPRTFAEYLQIIWQRRLMFLLVSGLVLVSTFINQAPLLDRGGEYPRVIDGAQLAGGKDRRTWRISRPS